MSERVSESDLTPCQGPSSRQEHASNKNASCIITIMVYFIDTQENLCG